MLANELPIEMFTSNEFVINVSRHQHVPPHRVLDGDARARVLAEWGSDLSHYPKLLPTDPICRHYGFANGELIHIVRTVGCQEPMDHYRVVSA